MLGNVIATILGSLVLFFSSPVRGQEPVSKPSAGQPLAPGLIKLTGDDEKRARQLDEQIDNALNADRWDEAIARAEELLALRTRAQGPKHFDTADAEWRLDALRRVAPMPHEERVAYQSASTMTEQAEALFSQGKFTQAEPLFQKALEIRRRLLTDSQPATAESYNNVAAALNNLGKSAQAQPLYEKALEINRRLLTDDHTGTATSYNNLAFNLGALGKYAAAQPLFEKALEINRRLLTDDHPDTARSYNHVANNLMRQGRYAQAQPLNGKALEIRRRLLTDEHRQTASSYNDVAYNLVLQGRYAQAQPLLEKSLEINRRLLGDDHPHTAIGYNNVAYNLGAQRKYGQAQPLLEKALEINRRVFSENHPVTAQGYNNVASNVNSQRKHVQAQPLYEKALEINRRLLTDDHPATATSYNNLADNLNSQGKYTQAQPMFEKGLEINRRLLTFEHPNTALSYNSLAVNLDAQGKYLEARDRWLSAVKSLDKARLRIAFTGLERAGETKEFARPALAAVLARLGQRAEAWQSLEEDLGRGLLDELAARQDRRLTPAERASLRELTTAMERLDKLVETTPKGLDQAERAKRFEDLKRKRELASIALGEFQAKLVQEHEALAGEVARLNEVQAALAPDAALVAWVDIAPAGPNAADPDGEHWGVVVRSRGIPTWIPIVGTGANGLWTEDDTGLAERVRTELRMRPGAGRVDLRTLVEKLRTQRIDPLASALGADLLAPPTAGGLVPARRLIVLPSRAIAGIPVEALFASDDTRIVSYAPSATVFKRLRELPRPDRHAGFLALGDPVYERPGASSEPEPLPDHGLLLSVVAPGSNAATHGLKPGDVLLAYNGMTLNKNDDLKVVSEGDKPIIVEVWRKGRSSRHDLAPGKLGAVIDTRPAPEAIAANRAVDKVLVASRGGAEDFEPLPGTRYEVEGLTRLFQSDDRPTRILLGADASEQELDRLASAGELGRFGFIHLATHGVIDEGVPAHSAVILTQTGLPDPLEQVLEQKPVFDGQLLVREIQRAWELKAELVTLSACETALGRDAGGEGFVGFTQALLMSGARSVCLSLWKVDDTATALLMQRFYANLLGRRTGLTAPLPKAEALWEAKKWLRGLRRSEVLALTVEQSGGIERGKGTKARQSGEVAATIPVGGDNDHPYEPPHFWAAFVLAGDPN
jgi:tetratricopeptide (TPR) repeat protein